MDPSALRTYVEASGAAVRAGAITPNQADEAFFRRQLGLPDTPKNVERAWQDAPVRKPITLKVSTPEE